MVSIVEGDAPEEEKEELKPQTPDAPTIRSSDFNSKALQQQTFVSPTKQEELKQQQEISSPKPTTSQIYKSAFGLHNVVVNALREPLDEEKTDPNFNPWIHIQGTQYDDERYYKYFAAADNEAEIEKVKQRIDLENQYRETLSQGGFHSVIATIAAGVLDPTILIPGTLGIKAARGGIKGIGTARSLSNLARGTASMSATSGLAIGIQETILQQHQLTRTMQESLSATVFGAMFGGILGGTVGLLSRGSKRALMQELKNIDALKEAPVSKIKFDGENFSLSQNLSAASAKEMDPDALAHMNFKTLERIWQHLPKDMQPRFEKLVKKEFGEGVFKLFSSPLEVFRAPTIRGLTSESQTLKGFTSGFFETPFEVNKSKFGIADRPIETAMKSEYASNLQMLNRSVQRYHSYLGIKSESVSKPRQLQAAIKARTHDGYMTKSEFDAEVRRLVESGEKSKIPEINQQVAEYRKVLDERLRELQEVNILSKEVTPEIGRGAKYYFPRVWSRNAVLANKEEFERLIIKWLRQGEKMISLEDAQEFAENLSNKIIGIGDDRLSIDSIISTVHKNPKNAGFIKQRLLSIPGDFPGITKFIRQDSQDVIEAYLLRTRTMIEFEKLLQAKGMNTIEEVRKAIRKETLEEFAAKGRAKIGSKLEKGKIVTDEQKLAVLNKFQGKGSKQAAKNVDLFNDIVDIVFGRIKKHNKLDTVLGVFRAFQTTIYLGGVMLSSIPDLAMHSIEHSLPRAIKNGMVDMAVNMKQINMSQKALKQFGVAIELQENAILRMLLEGSPEIGIPANRFMHVLNDIMDIYGKTTGLTYWNTLNKRMAAFMVETNTMNRLIKLERLSKKGKALPEADVAYLAKSGIGTDSYNKILKQIHKYSDKRNGTRIANFHLWDDKEALRLMGEHIRRRIDATILTPGLGDIPVAIQKSPVMRTIFQYKTFSATATNRLLLANLQRRNFNSLVGITQLIGMGYLSYVIKTKLAKKEPKTDINTIITEGIARSGLLGLIWGDYIVALNPWGQKSTRYRSTNTMGLLAGPGYSTIKNIIDVGYSALNADMSKSDISKARKLIPFNNIFWMRHWFDKAQEDLRDKVPDKRRKRSER